MWTGTMRDAHRLRAHHLCALPALLFVQLWGFFLGGPIMESWKSSSIALVTNFKLSFYYFYLMC